MQFYMISVSFFHVFIVNVEENALPGGGVLARFYRPGDGSFKLFLPGGWGIRPSKQLPGGGGGHA